MQLFLFQIESETHASLDEVETKHCIKVLRHSIGDILHGIDGAGNKYSAEIIKTTKKSVSLHILSRESKWGEHAYRIQLAVSPLRIRDRFEWIIEKAVELGVTEIYPVKCARSIKKQINQKRLESIMLSAVKQSKRSYIPKLHPLTPFKQFVQDCDTAFRYIPHCTSTEPLHNHQSNIQASQSLTFFIGPEGDFSEPEIELAQSHHFQPISLGTNRLRTETAAIYALSIIKGLKGW